MSKKSISIFITFLLSLYTYAGSGHLGDFSLWPGNMDHDECWSTMDVEKEFNQFETLVEQAHKRLAKKYPKPEGEEHKTIFEPAKLESLGPFSMGKKSLTLVMKVKETFTQARSYEYYSYEYYLDYSNPFLTKVKKDPTKLNEKIYDYEAPIAYYEKLQKKYNYNFFVESCSQVQPVRFSQVFWPVTTRAGIRSELDVNTGDFIEITNIE